MTSSLTSLPVELIELIIVEAIPEGFQSLTLSCKRFYTLCKPRIKHHNVLKRQYRHFQYMFIDARFPRLRVLTAFDLLARIAAEPVVARYIRHADFSTDSEICCSFGDMFGTDSEKGYRDRVAPFFENSSVLKEANLNGHDYLIKSEEEFAPSGISHGYPEYSQRAAVFLLTLLPNLTSLKLPTKWAPTHASNAVLDAVIRKARQQPWSFSNPCSLGKLTKVKYFPLSAEHEDCYELDHAKRFLALPQVQSLQAHGFIGNAIPGSQDVRLPPFSADYGANLTILELEKSCIDPEDIADLLAHTPRLKSFYYTHLMRFGGRSRQTHRWDIPSFLNAIATHVGSQLEELSVYRARRPGHGGPIVIRGGPRPSMVKPGRTILRGRFPRLRSLELPIEIAGCMSSSTVAHESETWNLFADLVPLSVTELSFVGPPQWDQGEQLEMLFEDFSSRKRALPDNLKAIHINRPSSAEARLEAECARLRSECLDIGIKLHVWPEDQRFTVNVEASLDVDLTVS